MEKTIEIPEGYEARIEGNKVILEPNDENIRSFLYEFIKICGWSEKQFPPREKCLAYLERQKDTGQNIGIKCINRETLTYIYNVCKGCVSDMSKEDFIKCVLSTIKTYKEQKPAEWSEEDSSMLSDIVGYITGAGSSSGITKQERVDFLYGLPKRFNLQPTQEWSEEDRRKINRIYDILGHAADDKGFLTSKRIIGDKEAIELQDFLKSLLPSWKPSEQERGAIRTAIHILTGERTFPKAVAHLQNILNAFEGKESRKDWKPSEEQMEALDYVIGILGDMGEANTLRELDADLKKL